jgi:diketogulonate reductase-like aldo/keto reductase
MGTWTLAGGQCADLVSHALRAGYRHIDTAASYDNEKAVGEGLRSSGVARNDIFVTTKVWWKDIAPKDLVASAEASLVRLGLDYVDLLLIHWPNPSVPVADSIGALNRLRERGLTRHIGVSNFPIGLLAEAIAASEAPLVANQVEYHPYLDQKKVHSACRAAGMAMVSYCPLSRGGSLFEEPAIAGAAARHGKTPGQVVLRWHVQQDGVVPIPRTTRKERLEENIAVFDFELAEDEMRAISGLRSADRRICDYRFSPRWDEP